MRATAAVVPAGRTATLSPTATRPEATVPAIPRKSPSGRLIHWAAMRNGRSMAAAATSTFSKWSSNVGPWYHGISVERRVTLSPRRAETGTQVISPKPNSAAKAR